MFNHGNPIHDNSGSIVFKVHETAIFFFELDIVGDRLKPRNSVFPVLRKTKKMF